MRPPRSQWSSKFPAVLAKPSLASSACRPNEAGSACEPVRSLSMKHGIRPEALFSNRILWFSDYDVFTICCRSIRPSLATNLRPLILAVICLAKDGFSLTPSLAWPNATAAGCLKSRTSFSQRATRSSHESYGRSFASYSNTRPRLHQTSAVTSPLGKTTGRPRQQCWPWSHPVHLRFCRRGSLASARAAALISAAVSVRALLASGVEVIPVPNAATSSFATCWGKLALISTLGTDGLLPSILRLALPAGVVSCNPPFA